jgi:hypothetical protein
MEMKYVRHEDTGFVLWPSTHALWHSDVGDTIIKKRGGKIISAGFARIRNGKAVCYGMSESLNISSMDGDTEALNKQLGLVDPVVVDACCAEYHNCEKPNEPCVHRLASSESKKQNPATLVTGVNCELSYSIQTPIPAGTYLYLKPDTEIDSLRAKLAAMQVDRDSAWQNVRILERARQEQDKETARLAVYEQRLNKLRRLCGYIENGSSSFLSLSQDDATGDWILKVGNNGSKTYFGSSFESAIDAAVVEED